MKSIIIPKELLPNDGRFGCGPSKIRNEQIEALAKCGSSVLGMSHRQNFIKNLVKECKEGIRKLYSLDELNKSDQCNEYEVILGNGGASVLWDIIPRCLIKESAFFNVVGKGEFANKAFLGSLKHTKITASSGDVNQEIMKNPDHVYDVIHITHNETSTGEIFDIPKRDELSINKKGDIPLLIVDGTSAAGAIFLNIADLDMYYFSLQKNLASEGGLFFAIVSQAVIKRVNQIESDCCPSFLSLKSVVENSLKDQTLNTPSISTLILLNEQLKWLNLHEKESQTALSVINQKVIKSSNYLYDWASNNQFVSPYIEIENRRSPVVVTLDIDERIDVKILNDILRRNGIYDTFSYRSLKRNQLRIATFVNIDFADIVALTKCLDYLFPKILELSDR